MDEIRKPINHNAIVIVVIIAAAVLVIAGVDFDFDFTEQSIQTGGGGGGTSETPNLYELTRQTAENTRHIFWLIVVCFTAWSFRSYKTGE